MIMPVSVERKYDENGDGSVCSEGKEARVLPAYLFEPFKDENTVHIASSGNYLRNGLMQSWPGTNSGCPILRFFLTKGGIL